MKIKIQCLRRLQCPTLESESCLLESMPRPTARAMMSPVVRLELELELSVPDPLPPPLLLLLLPLPLLPVPLVGELVSVGVDPAADVVPPPPLPPLLPLVPVATAASADTTAVDVLLGNGLFAAG